MAHPVLDPFGAAKSAERPATRAMDRLHNESSVDWPGHRWAAVRHPPSRAGLSLPARLHARRAAADQMGGAGWRSRPGRSCGGHRLGCLRRLQSDRPLVPAGHALCRRGHWVRLLLVPISIGIALLRSRLFDVDQIINRVLVYGSLSGVLALLYFGGVLALQGLVHGLTGQTQPVIVVITTLAIAALVQPLRRGLQREIDRRFYRAKYDAAHTLAAFSATLRDEVDLARLCEDLRAVEETMQPQHLSLWLPEAPLAPTSDPTAGE